MGQPSALGPEQPALWRCRQRHTAGTLRMDYGNLPTTAELVAAGCVKPALQRRAAGRPLRMACSGPAGGAGSVPALLCVPAIAAQYSCSAVKWTVGLGTGTILYTYRRTLVPGAPTAAAGQPAPTPFGPAAAELLQHVQPVRWMRTQCCSLGTGPSSRPQHAMMRPSTPATGAPQRSPPGPSVHPSPAPALPTLCIDCLHLIP